MMETLVIDVIEQINVAIFDVPGDFLCWYLSYKVASRLRPPPSFLPKGQKGYPHNITENISLSYFPFSNVFVGPLRSVLCSPTTRSVHRLTS